MKNIFNSNELMKSFRAGSPETEQLQLLQPLHQVKQKSNLIHIPFSIIE